VGLTGNPSQSKPRIVYFHIVASTVKGNVSACNIERLRLRRKGLGLVAWPNTVVRGHLLIALLAALAWATVGRAAALFFTS
jgi:hypothetical protein